MSRVLLIDNYDSFTYNLVHLVEGVGASVEVVRNDAVTVDEVTAAAPDVIIISPGPSRPEAAGICVELVRRLGSQVPILGVCLGHQAIAVAYGASVVKVEPVHGKRSEVLHDGRGLFSGLASPLRAARYHSLAVEPSSVPASLEVTARSPDGVVMGLAHRSHPVEGVQFHPESILSDHGADLVRTFLSRVG